MLVAIFLCTGCSSAYKKNMEKNAPSFPASSTTNSQYEENLNYLTNCIVMDFLISNNMFIGLLYDENQSVINLAKISTEQAIYLQDDFTQTCEILRLGDNRIALIDYGRNKIVKIYSCSDLALYNECDLSLYYESSAFKPFTGGDIVVDESGNICFMVTNKNSQEQIYILRDNETEPTVLYELDLLNTTDYTLAHITKLLLLTNDRLYFEGVIQNNGIVADEITLGYLDLSSGKVVEIQRADAVSYYVNNRIIYSQEYQKSPQDSGSGRVFIYNSVNNKLSDLKTESPLESLNGFVSDNGHYYCSFDNCGDTCKLQVYEVQSNKLLKSLETKIAVSLNLISIDSSNRFLYISNSGSILKYMEKYNF